LLSRPRRPTRAGEWTPGRAVTFIVTLAAHRSVTLAARHAGMSRKSAYALKRRDPAFAVAWQSALAAGNSARIQGDKIEETHDPRNSLGQGDTSPSDRSPERDRFARDLFFSRLAERNGDSAPLAGFRPLP